MFLRFKSKRKYLEYRVKQEQIRRLSKLLKQFHKHDPLYKEVKKDIKELVGV